MLISLMNNKNKMKTLRTAVAVLFLLFSQVKLQRCPQLDCGESDRLFLSRDSCFWVRPYENQEVTTDPMNGKISKIFIGSCEGQAICNIQPRSFVWLDTDLQMMKLTSEQKLNPANSQFYYKTGEGKCLKVENSAIRARLNAGRKCLEPTVCNSRVCDMETMTCDGKQAGDPCSGHMECDSDLACRAQTVWPYMATCQPRGEVRSLCETDFDCKMRNYCWQLGQNQDRICLEMHNAPYGTQFFWDSAKYPLVNKDSVLFHGKYCQSGVALRRSTSIAECVDIASVTVTTNGQTKTLPTQSNYACTPDGLTKCEYRNKNNEIAFNLTCECAMSQDANGKDQGYCPLPNQQKFKDYISAIKRVWYQDNCHTLDRENFSAMIECGVGDYDSRLKNAINLRFDVLYWPWVQDGQKSCLQRVFPDSPNNILF